MSGTRESFVPALGLGGLTQLYDLVAGSLLPEAVFKDRLCDQATIQPGQAVLDLGCGTGTLMLIAGRKVPEASIVGLDIDPAMLAVARRKAEAARLSVAFVEGSAEDLPFPEAHFDRVISSLFFHHLTTDQKRAVLQGIHGVLRPGGELHVADWGEARNVLQRIAYLPVQVFDGFETTEDNLRGRLVPLIEEAGLQDVEETHRRMTLFGVLSLYRARRGPPRQAPEDGPPASRRRPDATGDAVA